MKKNITLIPLLFVAAASASAQSSTLTQPIDFTKYNSFVIFGDSLSDDGNTGTVFDAAINDFSSVLSDYAAIPGWGIVSGYSSGSAGDFTGQMRFTNNNMWWHFFAEKVYEEINPNFSLGMTRTLPVSPYQLEFQMELWPGNIEGKINTGTNQNWAWGGAKVNMDNVLAVPPTPSLDPLDPSAGFAGGTVNLNAVSTQISHAISSKDSVIANDDVAIFLWAGANDYILYSQYGRDALETGLQAVAENYLKGKGIQIAEMMPANLAQTAAAGQVNNVRTLINAGARTLIIMGLPDISATPAANDGEFGNFSIDPKSYSEDYNSALVSGLEALQQEFPNATIRYFDVATALNDIIAKANQGSSTDSSTWYEGLNPNHLGSQPESAWVNSAGAFNVKVGASDVENQFAEWLFWDHVHPTQTGHRLLGEHLFDAIVDGNATDIPSPKKALATTGTANAQGLQDSWMGEVFVSQWPYFWHSHLGWNYYHSGDAHGLWAYDFSEDFWWYAQSNLWPAFYKETIADWMVAQIGFGDPGAGDLVKLSDYNDIKQTQAPDVVN